MKKFIDYYMAIADTVGEISYTEHTDDIGYHISITKKELLVSIELGRDRFEELLKSNPFKFKTNIGNTLSLYDVQDKGFYYTCKSPFSFKNEIFERNFILIVSNTWATELGEVSKDIIVPFTYENCVLKIPCGRPDYTVYKNCILES